jgi:hypothetical protein
MAQGIPNASVSERRTSSGYAAAFDGMLALYSGLHLGGNASTFQEDGSSFSFTCTDDTSLVMASTDSNGGTVTLPGSPDDGRAIIISDVDDNAGSNSITVDRNGNNIDGASSNGSIATNGDTIMYVWDDSNTTWRSVEF